MSLQSYRELEVWQVSMDLAEHCYAVTRKFPREELFGLVSQIRRASASVPTNIAEGQGRQHTKEFLNSLGYANGSLMELETHLLLSCRVGLMDKSTLGTLLDFTDRVGRMLTRLRQALENRL